MTLFTATPLWVVLLEGLRVDALGMNCGMGPEQMIPVLKEIATYTSLPIVVKPNAGLPKRLMFLYDLGSASASDIPKLDPQIITNNQTRSRPEVAHAVLCCRVLR